jgi:hypothetical protein
MFQTNTPQLSFNSDTDKSSKSSTTAWWGDVAHYATIFNTLLFAGTVAFYMNNDAASKADSSSNSSILDNLLDPAWKNQGFCIAHADEPYFTSHDMCLYVDAAAALVLTGVYLALRNTKGLEHANPLLATGIPGILGHGMGHGALAYAVRAGTMNDADSKKLGIDLLRGQGLTVAAAVLQQLPYLVFWLTLIKASLPNVKIVWVVLVAIVAQFLQLFVPTQFGFTYVQTVLMVAFSLNQLARPKSDKDFSYALYPAAVGFPLSMTGWMESTQCSNFVMDWLYGHVVYDAYIPCSMLLWYLTCYRRACNATSYSTTSTAVDTSGKEKTL